MTYPVGIGERTTSGMESVVAGADARGDRDEHVLRPPSGSLETEQREAGQPRRAVRVGDGDLGGVRPRLQ